MDDNVIKFDFDFGSASEVDADFYPSELEKFQTKASPSHESDSGLSGMSEQDSPSPSTPVCDFLDEDAELYDLQSPGFGSFSDTVDSELVGYLTSEQESAPMLTDNGQEIIHEVSLSSPECVDVELSPESPPAVVSNTRHSQRLLDCNSSTTSAFSSVSTFSAPKPTIKVVKVIKAAADASVDDMDKQLYEALDERNRKNATQAKINRQKKKAFIQGLEDESAAVKAENATLKADNKRVNDQNKILEEEVEYLKSVLANQSTLAGLLQNIPSVKNIRLTSSFSERKRGADHDHDYIVASKRARTSPTAGVCMHVDKDHVSLEFCSGCSKMAKGADHK